MSGAPRVGTLGDRLKLLHDLTAYCPACRHSSKALPIEDLCERYGAGLELETFCQRLRCKVCGHLGGDVSISVRARG